MRLNDLPYALQYDALTLLCEERLGAGVSRTVWSTKLDGGWVVKWETETGNRFQNVCEWTVWQAVHELPIARWFAPCIVISESGNVLIQARTVPVTLEQLQRRCPKVPAFFTDLKVSNWGQIGGRIVCHDYGTANTTQRGINMTMRKADWWE